MRPFKIVLYIIILFWGTFVFSGCGKDRAQPVSSPERGGGGSVTLWSDSVEMFTEYPGLVVGMECAFAVHLTTIEDHKPITEGKLTLSLTSREGESLQFIENTPSHPGIYRPVVTFKTPGVYKGVFTLTGPQANDEIVVDSLIVTDAPLPPEDDDEEDGIVFLKEQAWKVPFEVREVKKVVLNHTISIYGEIVPASGKHAIITAPFSGIIYKENNHRLPRLGQNISTGKVLLKMTPPKSVADGWMAYTQSREMIKLAETNYNRAKRLHEKNAISLSEFQKAEVEYNQIKSSNSEFIIKAPISGIINKNHVILGKQVEVGTPLLELIDPRIVWVEANVPINKIDEISGVKSALIYSKRNGSGIKGKLVSIGEFIDDVSKTLPIVFEVKNSDKTLKIGAPVTVEALLHAEEKVLAIPVTAVFDDNNKRVVYVQTTGEAFEKRLITPGFKSGDMIEVCSGLDEGEQIVTVGGFQVHLASLSSSVPAHGHGH